MDCSEGNGARAATRCRTWLLAVGGVVTALVGLAALLVLCFWPSVRVDRMPAEDRAEMAFLMYVLPGLALGLVVVATFVRRVLAGVAWTVPAVLVSGYFISEWRYDEVEIAHFLLRALAASSVMALATVWGRCSSRVLHACAAVLSTVAIVALAYVLWGLLLTWGAMLTVGGAVVSVLIGGVVGGGVVWLARWLDARKGNGQHGELPRWGRATVAWLPTLALCYMAVRTMGMTQAAPPERFVPTPKTATLVYTTERWSVWVHRELVKRTRQCIRPSQVFRYYLQAKPRDPATLVFITTSTEPHRVVGVLGDGTVALQWRCYDFAVVTREGEQLFRQPIDVDGDLAWVSAAYDNGVLLQEYDTSPTDVFFVPWSPPVLDMEKRVRVTTKEVDYHRCPYWRSGDTLAWSTRKDIRLFELKTRIERSLMYEADRRYSRQITAFDGKTITLEGVLYDVATGRTTASGP